MKNGLIISALIIFTTIMLGLSLRGLPGNPTITQLDTWAWKDAGPLELSPERGRYALLYSLIEEKSLAFSVPVAQFATPDVGYHNGRYVSLFAPGVSFLAAPGYLLGKYLGAAQVGTFAVIALFAVLNAGLIYGIARHLQATPAAAAVGALTFTFASPAFAYAVSLYQHHLSTFLILASIYALLRWNNYWSLALTWLLTAAALSIDYPNLIFMLPIALFALGRIVAVKLQDTRLSLAIRWPALLTGFAIIPPLLFFAWFNQTAYGNPWKLAGTVVAVKAIDATGNPAAAAEDDSSKSAVTFFETRNLLHGFQVHFVSPDRGIILYTPIMLFGILGIIYLYKRNASISALLLAIIGMNVLLYSMWGDPWGGWAFGSRYLIPSYALMSIFVAIALSVWRKNWLFLALFLLLFSYSTAVNTLGALTTNANPPQVEVAALEKLSGRQQLYTYEREYQYLQTDGSKSFAWQTVIRPYLSAVHYAELLAGATIAVALAGLLYLYFYDYA